MNKKILAVIITSLISGGASAVTIDYRHEMKDTEKRDHRDRLSISHRFNNGFGLSVEAKWRQHNKDTTPDKAYNETVTNGTEVVASYQYKLTKAFTIQPGFSLETNTDNNGYRPYLRLHYTFDNNIYTAARYRYEYQRFSDPNVSKDDKKTNRLDTWVGYKWGAYQIEYNYLYKRANQIEFNNKKNDYEHNVKLAYSIDKNWRPYMEIGNVKQNSKSDERQTRYRVGLQYIF